MCKGPRPTPQDNAGVAAVITGLVDPLNQTPYDLSADGKIISECGTQQTPPTGFEFKSV